MFNVNLIECADSQGRRVNAWEERHQIGFEKYIHKPLRALRGPPVERNDDEDRVIVVPPPRPAGAIAPAAAPAPAPAAAAALAHAPAAAQAPALAPARAVVAEPESPPPARDRSPPAAVRRDVSRRDSSEEEDDQDEEDEPTASPAVCTYSQCIKGEGCVRQGIALETCDMCKTMSVHRACMPGFRRFGKFIHLYPHLRTVVLCFSCASGVVNDAMRDVQRGKGRMISTPHSARKGSGSSAARGRAGGASSSGGASRKKSRFN